MLIVASGLRAAERLLAVFPWARARVGRLQERYGAPVDALKTYAAVAGQRPGSAAAASDLVRSARRVLSELGDAGRWEEAVAALRAATGVAGDVPELLHAQAAAEEGAELQAAAARTHERLAGMGEGVDHWRRAGRIWARISRPGDAAAAYREAVELEPTDADSLDRLAKLLSRQERWSEAAEALERLSGLREGDVPILERLVSARERAEEWTGAARALERLAETQRSSSEPCERAGGLYLRAGKPEAALECFREALRREPRGRRALAGIYKAAADAGRWSDALEAVEVLYDEGVRDAGTLAWLAKARAGVGDRSGAVEALVELTSSRPRDARAWRRLARAAMRAGREDEALRALEQWVTLQPENVGARRRLALLYARRSSWTEAAEQFRRLADLPGADRVEALTGLAKALEEGGDPGAAARAWQELADRGGADDDVRLQAARLFLASGEHDEAFEESVRALGETPTFESLATFGREIRRYEARDEVELRIRRSLGTEAPSRLVLGRLALELGSPGLAYRAFERAGLSTEKGLLGGAIDLRTLLRAPLDSQSRAGLELSAMTARPITPEPDRGEAPESRSGRALVLVEAEADPEVVEAQLPEGMAATFVLESQDTRVRSLAEGREGDALGVSEFVAPGGTDEDAETSATARAVAKRATEAVFGEVAAPFGDLIDAETEQACALLVESDVTSRLKKMKAFVRATREIDADAVFLALADGSMLLTASRAMLEAGVPVYLVSASTDDEQRLGAVLAARDAATGSFPEAREDPDSGGHDRDDPPLDQTSLREFASRSLDRFSRHLKPGDALVLANLRAYPYRMTVASLLRRITVRRGALVKHFGRLDSDPATLVPAGDAGAWSEAVRIEGEGRHVADEVGEAAWERLVEPLLVSVSGAVSTGDQQVEGIGSIDALLAPILDKFVSRELPYHLDLARRARRAMREAPPAFVIVSPGWTPAARIVVSMARRAGVPTVDVQALMARPIPRYKPPNAAWATVLDRAQKALYVEHFGLSPKRVEAVGYAALDIVRERLAGISRDQAARSVGIDPGARPIVAFATQPDAIDKQLAVLSALLDALRELPAATLMVKMHPAEGEARRRRYERLVEEEEGGGGIRASVVRKADIHTVIWAADLVVTRFSNVGIEAACLGRAVLAASLEPEPPEIDLGQLGVAEPAYRPETLIESLRELLQLDPEAAHQRTSARYLRDNPASLEGNAGERIVALAEALRD